MQAEKDRPSLRDVADATRERPIVVVHDHRQTLLIVVVSTLAGVALGFCLAIWTMGAMERSVERPMWASPPHAGAMMEEAPLPLRSHHCPHSSPKGQVSDLFDRHHRGPDHGGGHEPHKPTP